MHKRPCTKLTVEAFDGVAELTLTKEATIWVSFPDCTVRRIDQEGDYRSHATRSLILGPGKYELKAEEPYRRVALALIVDGDGEGITSKPAEDPKVLELAKQLWDFQLTDKTSADCLDLARATKELLHG